MRMPKVLSRLFGGKEHKLISLSHNPFFGESLSDSSFFVFFNALRIFDTE